MNPAQKQIWVLARMEGFYVEDTARVTVLFYIICRPLLLVYI
jgi:hypothetical protein